MSPSRQAFPAASPPPSRPTPLTPWVLQATLDVCCSSRPLPSCLRKVKLLPPVLLQQLLITLPCPRPARTACPICDTPLCRRLLFLYFLLLFPGLLGQAYRSGKILFDSYLSNEVGSNFYLHLNQCLRLVYSWIIQ